VLSCKQRSAVALINLALTVMKLVLVVVMLMCGS